MVVFGSFNDGFEVNLEGSRDLCLDPCRWANSLLYSFNVISVADWCLDLIFELDVDDDLILIELFVGIYFGTWGIWDSDCFIWWYDSGISDSRANLNIPVFGISCIDARLNTHYYAV